MKQGRTFDALEKQMKEEKNSHEFTKRSTVAVMSKAHLFDTVETFVGEKTSLSLHSTYVDEVATRVKRLHNRALHDGDTGARISNVDVDVAMKKTKNEKACKLKTEIRSDGSSSTTK